MATLVRIVLWLVWAIGIGWLWHEGMLGAASALAALAAGSALAVWRGVPVRRKRSELRYVQMGKQPVA